MSLLAIAEWGGRGATADEVADSLLGMVGGLPVPAGVPDTGWFDLQTSRQLSADRGVLADWVAEHSERDGSGAVQPRAGYSFAVAHGDGSASANDDLPFVSVTVMAGVEQGGARIAANSVRVSASNAWADAASTEDVIAVVTAVVDAWAPAWATAYDRLLIRRLPRRPDRMPWAGYVSYFSTSTLATPSMSGYRIDPFAQGHLAVRDRPWDPESTAEESARLIESRAAHVVPEVE